MRHLRTFTLVSAIAATATMGTADTIYVDDDNCPGGTGTAVDPFCSIQDAIDLATAGDEVIVSPGTYFERIDLDGKAITLRSTDPLDPSTVAATVINSGGVNPAVSFDSGEGSGTVFSGFTITGATGTGNSPIQLLGTSPTVSHCTFTGNHGWPGGVMYITAAVAHPNINNCEFIGNTSLRAGAIYSQAANPSVSQCTFSNNSSGREGAVINYFGNISISDSLFTGNSGERTGAVYTEDGTTEIRNCEFIGNSATGGTEPLYAGGVSGLNSTTTLEGCYLSGNSGAAVSSYGTSTSTLINCTLRENSAPGPDAGGVDNQSGTVTATNCILWGNTPSEISGPVTVSYSDVQGGFAGVGNMDIDPKFTSASDSRLVGNSPCIDAGDNSVLSPGYTTDLAGEPRLTDIENIADVGNGTGPIVDLGAFEVQRALGAENYCVAFPNSVSLDGAQMSAAGTFTFQSNNTVLSATDVPNTFGIFFYGPSSNLVVPFGDGALCVGSPITRLNPAGSAVANTATYALDLGPGGVHSAISEGDHWYFQYWYRDPGQGSGFNTSDGLDCVFGDLD